MQAIMLALALAVGGDPQASPAPYPSRPTLPSSAYQGAEQAQFAQPQPEAMSDEPGMAEAGSMPQPYRYAPPRDPHESDGLVRGFFMYCYNCFQPMPQTCYSPHFGCYPGNGRDIQRYPAFHGYYYRQAYNYRALLEYPWQAGMNEPQPLEMNGDRSLGGAPMPVMQATQPEVIAPPSHPKPYP